MRITHKMIERLPIPEGDIVKNRLGCFARKRLVMVEIETNDDLVGVGLCRLSDEDMRNPKFRDDPNFARNLARWRAGESIRRQRAGERMHDPLMR